LYRPRKRETFIAYDYKKGKEMREYRSVEEKCRLIFQRQKEFINNDYCTDPDIENCLYTTYPKFQGFLRGSRQSILLMSDTQLPYESPLVAHTHHVAYPKTDYAALVTYADFILIANQQFRTDYKGNVIKYFINRKSAFMDIHFGVWNTRLFPEMYGVENRFVDLKPEDAYKGHIYLKIAFSAYRGTVQDVGSQDREVYNVIAKMDTVTLNRVQSPEMKKQLQAWADSTYKAATGFTLREIDAYEAHSKHEAYLKYKREYNSTPYQKAEYYLRYHLGKRYSECVETEEYRSDEDLVMLGQNLKYLDTRRDAMNPQPYVYPDHFSVFYRALKKRGFSTTDIDRQYRIFCEIKGLGYEESDEGKRDIETKTSRKEEVTAWK
jgi:hypothetical protein